MIDRLTCRRSFARLRSAGLRRGRGPIRVISHVDPAEIPRIAFAIPRSVGNSVARNRIRRRIRPILREMCEGPTPVAGGDHLIRVQAPIEHWPHARLVVTLTELLGAERAGRP